jgi:hypothetical protein
MIVMLENFPTKGLTWKKFVLYDSPFKFQDWFYLEWEGSFFLE